MTRVCYVGGDGAKSDLKPTTQAACLVDRVPWPNSQMDRPVDERRHGIRARPVLPEDFAGWMTKGTISKAIVNKFSFMAESSSGILTLFLDGS